MMITQESEQLQHEMTTRLGSAFRNVKGGERAFRGGRGSHFHRLSLMFIRVLPSTRGRTKKGGIDV